jgi:hypothetical protein
MDTMLLEKVVQVPAIDAQERGHMRLHATSRGITSLRGYDQKLWIRANAAHPG